MDPMIAVYAGSFDPITVGHLDVIQRSSKLFENLVVGVGTNSAKSPLLTAGERQLVIREACSDLSNVTVNIFSGLLVNYCKEIGASVIVRGLRAVSDFEAELAMAHVNYMLDPEIETVFLDTKANNSFISSSMVKEIARNKGDFSKLVPPNVEVFLIRKLRG
jgi:pantetheine-phosphate adenylyltransferase